MDGKGKPFDPYPNKEKSRKATPLEEFAPTLAEKNQQLAKLEQPEVVDYPYSLLQAIMEGIVERPPLCPFHQARSPGEVTWLWWRADEGMRPTARVMATAGGRPVAPCDAGGARGRLA